MKKQFLFKRGKYYHLQYFDKAEGKIKRISTERTNKNDALAFLMEFQGKIEIAPSVTKLLNDFIKEYQSFIEVNLSKQYLAEIKTTFKELLAFVGNIPLTKISSQILEQHISIVGTRSKHQAKKHYNNLRSAFNKAIVWDYIDYNPLSKIKPPKVPSNNPLFISESELNLILNKEPDKTLRDFYTFAFHTGMRLGEITNLKWNQVSFSDRIIKVINTDEFTTKGKKERVIPINQTLFPLLQKKLPQVVSIQNSNYVFNKKDLKFNNDYISKKFKKALLKCKEINSKFHFHDLRHSFASNLVKNEVSIFVVKELLGHADIRTTQTYSHLTVDSLREAVKVLEV